MYHVNESDASVSICALLVGRFEQEIFVNVSTEAFQTPPIASRFIFFNPFLCNFETIGGADQCNYFI